MDSIIVVFIAGVLGSVGHCVMMCGGIVGTLTAGLDKSIQTNKMKVLQYHLSYNLGRIISYTIMGAIFGFFGSMLIEMTFAAKMMRIVSGALMIALGLYLAGWWFGLQKLEKIGGLLWNKIQPIVQKILPVKSYKQAFTLGLFWGYLPCGIVYSALAFSMASGSIYSGALIMLAFGLGTLPSLLLMGGISGVFSEFIKRKAVRITAGVLIIIMGVLAVLMPLKSLVSGKEHNNNMPMKGNMIEKNYTMQNHESQEYGT